MKIVEEMYLEPCNSQEHLNSLKSLEFVKIKVWSIFENVLKMFLNQIFSCKYWNIWVWDTFT